MNQQQAKQAFEALRESPAAFRQALVIDADGTPKRLSEAVDDWQRRDFESLDDSLRRVVNPANKQLQESIQRHWWERPRGHSKTSDIAVAVSYLLFASRRKIRGVCGSGDKDQARLVRDSLDTLVRMNPWLGDILEVQAMKVINRHTKSELEILSSDAASSYGHLVDFVVLDELTHWAKRDLFDSLFSATAKRKHCLLLAIANAGFVDSWQWSLREAIRVDVNWKFSRLEGPQASWQSESALAEQERLLPNSVWRRLWLNEWSDNQGDGLPADLIQAALTMPAQLNRPKPGFVYLGALDLGLSRDYSALAILGKDVGYSEPIRRPKKVLPVGFRAMADLGMIAVEEPPTEYRQFGGTGKLELAGLRFWKPQNGRIEISEIEKEILAIHSVFSLSKISYDPWQAEFLAERLAKQNLWIEPAHQTPNNLQEQASATLTAFREKQLAIFPHEQLEKDLRALRIVERSYGYRLESPRGEGHGDCATALSIALGSARKINSQLRLPTAAQLVLFP